MLKKALSLRARHLLLIVVGALVACPAARAGDELQYRISAKFVLEIAEHWKGTLGVESRYDDSGHQIKSHNDIGVAYIGISDWLDLGANYRSIFRVQEDDKWVREDRFYLNFIARHRLLGVGFSHRIRLEYNHWEQRIDDFGTVRYRIGINSPFELDPIRERRILKDYKVRPYGSYELSYNTSDRFVAAHSFKAGLSVSITQKIISNLAYIREESGSKTDAHGVNVLELEFKLLF